MPLHLAPLLGPVIHFIYAFVSGPRVCVCGGGGSKGSECVAAPLLFTSTFDRSLFAPAVALRDLTLNPLRGGKKNKGKGRKGAQWRGNTPREADNTGSLFAMARESARLVRRKRRREGRRV